MGRIEPKIGQIILSYEVSSNVHCRVAFNPHKSTLNKISLENESRSNAVLRYLD